MYTPQAQPLPAFSAPFNAGLLQASSFVRSPPDGRICTVRLPVLRPTQCAFTFLIPRMSFLSPKKTFLRVRILAGRDRSPLPNHRTTCLIPSLPHPHGKKPYSECYTLPVPVCGEPPFLPSPWTTFGNRPAACRVRTRLSCEARADPCATFPDNPYATLERPCSFTRRYRLFYIGMSPPPTQEWVPLAQSPPRTSCPKPWPCSSCCRCRLPVWLAPSCQRAGDLFISAACCYSPSLPHPVSASPIRFRPPPVVGRQVPAFRSPVPESRDLHGKFFSDSWRHAPTRHIRRCAPLPRFHSHTLLPTPPHRSRRISAPFLYIMLSPAVTPDHLALASCINVTVSQTGGLRGNGRGIEPTSFWKQEPRFLLQ